MEGNPEKMYYASILFIIINSNIITTIICMIITPFSAEEVTGIAKRKHNEGSYRKNKTLCRERRFKIYKEFQGDMEVNEQMDERFWMDGYSQWLWRVC